MTLPPRQSGTNISNTERSKHTEVAARTPSSSSLLKVALAQKTRFTALRCSTETPFGRPVEPDVKMTYAALRGLPGVGGSEGGGAKGRLRQIVSTLRPRKRSRNL